MKYIFINYLIIAITFCFSLSAEDLGCFHKKKPMKDTIIESIKFSWDSGSFSVNGIKLKKHLSIFNAIHNIYKSLSSDADTTYDKRNYCPIKINLRQDKKGTEYSDLAKYGIVAISLDENDFPTQIFFISKARGFTLNEYEFNKNNNKNPSSYCTVSEKEAIGIASNFLDKLYGENKYLKYDSISVYNADKKYVINFLVKIKNEIADNSRTTVTINPNSGLIESYSGGPIKTVDYTFVPKVSKSYVLKRYEEEKMKLNATIDINTIELNTCIIKGKSQWIWKIYGVRKDKDLGTAAMMFFDSETGEVLFKRID